MRLADREGYTLAYFHEPRFDARIRPLRPDPGDDTVIHYGEHFTRMFMRCHPRRRATTRRIEAEELLLRLGAVR